MRVAEFDDLLGPEDDEDDGWELDSQFSNLDDPDDEDEDEGDEWDEDEDEGDALDEDEGDF